MLSPPVDNFIDPEALFHIERIAGKFPIDSKYITNFNFTHLISITLPDTLMTPEILTEDFTKKTDYYKVSNLCISDLIDKIFLKCFVSSGKLSLLSINTRIDCDNTFAVTSKGELILNLNKDTYQSLGLDGKVSHFESKLKSQYVVTINLIDPELINNSLKLTKLKTRLKILEKFTVVLFWEPHQKDICPSSIAKYIYDIGQDITLSHSKFQSHTAYSVKVPCIELDKASNGDIVDFMEWLGMVSLEGDLEKDCPSDYVNSYATPTPNSILGQVKCLKWTGLFTPDQVQDLISKVVSYNDENNKPWISVYVQGFSDTPVIWAHEEQNYFTSGDNSYTVIFKQNYCLFCTHMCSRKIYK